MLPQPGSWQRQSTRTTLLWPWKDDNDTVVTATGEQARRTRADTVEIVDAAALRMEQTVVAAMHGHGGLLRSEMRNGPATESQR